MRLVSQLIKGILRVLQKLRCYFNGTAISTSFVLATVGFFPAILIFDVNVSEFAVSSCGSYLKYSHKLPDVFK